MFRTVFVAMVALAAAAGLARAEFKGALEAASGGLSGAGGWADGPASIEWTVSQLSSGNWRYTYVLTVPSGKAGRVILETSPALKGEDITTFASSPMASSNEVTRFNSLPHLSQHIYALATTPNARAAKVMISFETAAPPTWGDFQVQGPEEDPGSALWNTGFAPGPGPESDPVAPAASGSIDNHILVPGGNGGIYPMMALWNRGSLGGPGAAAAGPIIGTATATTDAPTATAPEPTTLAATALTVATLAGTFARRRKKSRLNTVSHRG
ncbi:MAG: PEP-CTERM sorting domain-containing protein [Planctomycetaceae bacterium]|nr:PEP-CTERM sorting domain-containing protein [Planctomycetaceae bacterium]